MECSEAGRKGGKSRSEKKIAAVRKNVAKARRKMAENLLGMTLPAVSENELTDTERRMTSAPAQLIGLGK
jgi:hypothetical protein